MLRLFALALVLAMAACGCAARKTAAGSPPTNGTKGSNLIVIPESGLAGKVVRVNPSARFAILNFPIGRLPSIDQRLNVYRLGLKVGEIKVTGPQKDDNIVGDIFAGDAQPGDEVRDR